MSSLPAIYSGLSLTNEWEVDIDGDKFSNQEPMWVIDQSTGERYLNESDATIRRKGGLLAIFCCIPNLGTSLMSMGGRFLDLTCIPDESARNESKETKIAKMIYAPITYLGMQFAACYACLGNPKDGRKLFTQLESIQYGDTDSFAPCFKPQAKKHLLGGNLEMHNSY
ncbi:MAG: hypothetical protein COT85_02455 [Chlamydiae bacterium CG10_big_fil_rev_8_21_14_0_10_42_34]|nr:MAG: hypothetical protein COT85_02455 [Chlamydiae bacterium CG10_big_fil_rev_8_21_14_0_10_42_34]